MSAAHERLRAVEARLDGERLEALFFDLLEVYSPPYAEGPLVERLGAELDARGITVERQQVGSSPRRQNLVLRAGPEPLALLWLGHLDTVELWHEGGHRPRRDGDLVWGLGTADMKSGCAAAIEAFTALVTSGVQLERGIAVGLVVGEEDAGDGALVMRERVTAPLTVIGEPTSLEPCVDHFSYLELLVEARGKRAHAALPEVGANAIHAMLEVVSAVLESRASWPDADRTALSVRRISGGEPHFVVAEHCEAQIDVHLPPGAPAEPVEEAFQAAIVRASQSHEGVSLSLRRVFWAPGYATTQADARVAPLERAFAHVGVPWVPATFRSHSDANLFHDFGTLTVVCGPGSLDVAHRRSEHVSLTEVHAAARLYAALFAAATSAEGA